MCIDVYKRQLLFVVVVVVVGVLLPNRIADGLQVSAKL